MLEFGYNESEDLWNKKSIPKVKADKMPPEEFFKLITSSEKIAKKFIKELLAPAAKGRANLDITTAYHGVIAANTNVDNLSATKNTACNFKAFNNELLLKFNIDRDELKALVKSGDEPVNQNPARKKPRRYGHDKTMPPKAMRPTAEEYFKEMTSTRDSIVAFIEVHLAPAVAGRVRHTIGGSYYGALAKNTCEVSGNLVQNVACNYKAFKKKLEEHSISKEELNNLLKIELKHATKVVVKKSRAERQKEKVFNILYNKLNSYIIDSVDTDDLIKSIYIELEPLLRKRN